MEHEIFISYSRKNLKEVKAIKKFIEQEIGRECWMDLDDIESGDQHFTKTIVDGINACKICLFMRSKESQSSQYALRELKFAEDKNKKIVIIHIDDSPLDDDFKLLYGLADTISWSDTPQREKLFRDLKRWLNIIIPEKKDIGNSSVPTSHEDNIIVNEKERPIFPNGRMFVIISLCILTFLVIWQTHLLPGNFGLWMFCICIAVFAVVVFSFGPFNFVREVFSNYENNDEDKECIDLGLPSRTLWAKTNVGAQTPTELGDYYAWGETMPKIKFEKGNYTIRKLALQSIAASSFDAATQNYGKNWCMPSSNQFEELMNCCSLLWIDNTNGCGYKIIGKNGNELFLPAVNREGYFYGNYWTVDDIRNKRIASEEGLNDYERDQAEALRFDNYTHRIEMCEKYMGMNIRAVRVSKKQKTIFDM